MDISLGEVESNAARPEYLGRYDGRVTALKCGVGSSATGALLASGTVPGANTFWVSPSRFGSVVRPYIDDITEANEYIQSAV